MMPVAYRMKDGVRCPDCAQMWSEMRVLGGMVQTVPLTEPLYVGDERVYRVYRASELVDPAEPGVKQVFCEGCQYLLAERTADGELGKWYRVAVTRVTEYVVWAYDPEEAERRVLEIGDPEVLNEETLAVDAQSDGD